MGAEKGNCFTVTTICTETEYQLLSKMYIAGKQCYGNLSINDIIAEIPPDDDKSIAKMNDFIGRILDSGHESILENVSFMFSIEGVSRAMSYQLVRHRLASYMQQSQRRVDCSDFDYVVPPAIRANRAAYEVFTTTMEMCADAYKRIDVLLGGKKKEDARFVLPNACKTRLTMNANLRSLVNFFGLRLCKKAQWEIRNVALYMFRGAEALLPTIMKRYGPRCVEFGICPESKSCGIFPERAVVNELIRIFEETEGGGQSPTGRTN